MKGRKPLPTQLKVLPGNPGGRGLTANEPTGIAGVGPAHPLFLDKTGRRYYGELARILGPSGANVLTNLDRLMLELLADAVAEFLEAKAVLRENGLTFTQFKLNRKGERVEVGVKKRPEVMIAKDVAARVRGFATEFGMTPSSRTRIVTVAEVAEAADIEDLFG